MSLGIHSQAIARLGKKQEGPTPQNEFWGYDPQTCSSTLSSPSSLLQQAWHLRLGIHPQAAAKDASPDLAQAELGDLLPASTRTTTALGPTR